MDIDTFISMNKAIAWEQAKCALRTIVAVEGQRSSGTIGGPYPFQKIEAAVDAFINTFEGEGYHE